MFALCLPLETCCCCISLNVGTKLIGIIFTMISALEVVMYTTPAVLSDLPASRMLFYNIMAVGAASHVVLGCIMTIGAFKKKPSLLTPWLVFTWVFSLCLLVLCFVGLCVQVYVNLNSAGEINWVISAYFIYAVFLFYLASVVSSRKDEIEQESEMNDFDYTYHLRRPTKHNMFD